MAPGCDGWISTVREVDGDNEDFYREVETEIERKPTPPDLDRLYEYIDGAWQEKIMGGELSGRRICSWKSCRRTISR